MNVKQKTLSVLAILISLLSLLYLTSQGTLTAYESETTTQVFTSLASWNIELNGQSMTDQTDKVLTLNDMTWSGTHVNASTVAPGSKGTLQLTIDPTTTDVAIRYEISYRDRSMDPDYLFTVTSITLDDASLVQTGENTYTGIFTKEELLKHTTKTLRIGLAWINDETMNEQDSAIGRKTTPLPDAIALSLSATQYLGEKIVPFKK